MKVFDLHSDFLTETSDIKSVINSLKNVKVLAAIYRGNMQFQQAKLIVEKFKNIRQNRAFLAFEDLGYCGDFEDEIISMKPLSASLTYNGENQFGYGCNFNLPLKKQGVNFAKKLAKNNVKLDVAHLSQKGAFSLIDAGLKVYSSHTAVKEIYNHKRNLSNELIKEIANSGGIIGVTPVTYFLGGNSLESYAKHIDYIVQKHGDKCVAIGSDFYGTDSLAGNLKNYNDFSKLEQLLTSWGYTKLSVSRIFHKNAEIYFNLI